MSNFFTKQQHNDTQKLLDNSSIIKKGFCITKQSQQSTFEEKEKGRKAYLSRLREETTSDIIFATHNECKY